MTRRRPSLRHHYVAYRAFVRAKVACLRLAPGRPARGGEARQLAAMALQHLRAGAVTLVLIGGLPGTGKSALAGTLADRLGCTVLSSDRIRKELAGLPAEQQSPAALRQRDLRPALDRAHLPNCCTGPPSCSPTASQ